MQEPTTRIVPHSRFNTTFLALAGIVLLTLAVRVWIVAHTEVTSRDSIIFIRYALRFESPPPHPDHPERRMTRWEVVKTAEHPPGYPLAVLLVSYPVRAIYQGTSCESMVLSTQITSVLAALMLTFPLYFLGRILLDRRKALLAVLLFQTLPVWALKTSDGLSEGLYILAAVTTLWLAVRAFRSPTPRGFFIAGVGTGVAYLIRPEGVLVGFACGLVCLLLLMRRQWTLREGSFRIAGLCAGAAALAVPYMLLIGKPTNKPSGDVLTKKMLGQEAEPTWIIRDQTSVAPTIPFAAFDLKGGPTQHVLLVGNELVKTLHYVLPVLAVWGLWLLRRRLVHDPAITLLGVQFLIYLAALVALSLVVQYVSERHMLLLAFISCFLVAEALPDLAERATRLPRIGHQFRSTQWLAGGVLFLMLSAIPASLKSLHANRAGHRSAGLWLAEHVREGEVICDPFAWAEFYSGRGLRESPDLKGIIGRQPTYAIVEPRASHSRLPLDLPARQFAAHGTPVWHSPPGELAHAKVIIYWWDPTNTMPPPTADRSVAQSPKTPQPRVE